MASHLRYVADDIITTDPSGRITNKAQDKMDLSSGDFKLESMELSNLKVQSYGNTAVAAGTNALKGTYKGQDITGSYRFTDTWVSVTANGSGCFAVHQATVVSGQSGNAGVWK